nr:MAG TPA: hypothetical protein [Caudoviricetes sp.]
MPRAFSIWSYVLVLTHFFHLLSIYNYINIRKKY